MKAKLLSLAALFFLAQRGGFLGLNQKEWAHYQSQLALAIATLESQR